jgi:hypothetical protein
VSTVKIIKGKYHQNNVVMDMADRQFKMITGYVDLGKYGYVTVDTRNEPDLPGSSLRVYVKDINQIEVHGGPAVSSAPSAMAYETDEAIIERLRVRFDQLEQMTRAVKHGDIRALIVSGPPGVGKSHGVERVLDRYQLVETLGGEKKYDIVKGAMSALGLYVKLYKFCNKDNVLVFDDCDSIFSDELSLNILKAALDSKKRRMIHWNTDSIKLRNEGVPDQFCFEGSCIFITNLKFDRARGKIREHLAALESRCHFMDLTIDTQREKMLRIRQISSDGMLKDYGFDEQMEKSIVDFVDANQNKLRELSLRTVVKIANLAKAFPDQWQAYAYNTVMK